MPNARKARLRAARTDPVGWVYVVAADVLPVPKAGVCRWLPRQALLSMLGHWMERGLVVRRCEMWAVRSQDRHQHGDAVRVALAGGDRNYADLLRRVCGAEAERVEV